MPFGDPEFSGLLTLCGSFQKRADGATPDLRSSAGSSGSLTSSTTSSSPSSSLGSSTGSSSGSSSSSKTSVPSPQGIRSNSESNTRTTERSPLRKFKGRFETKAATTKAGATEEQQPAPGLPQISPFTSLGDVNSTLLRQLFDLPPEEVFYGTVRCSFFSPILIHGSLYFSNNHICFYSRFLGRVTQELLNVDQVFTISKKLTTSNVIVQTRSKSYNFLSFRGIDLYSILIKVWKREAVNLQDFQEVEEIDVSGLLSDKTWEGDFWEGRAQQESISADFPVSVPSFFKKFFEEPFTRLFYERRGATEISIDPWTKDEKFGMIREVSMKTELLRGGTSVVNLVQKANLQHDHLVILGTQVFRDAPFGDTIQFETKMEVKQTGPKSCHLIAYHALSGSSKLFTSSHEAMVSKEGDDLFAFWVSLARGELLKKKKSKESSETASEAVSTGKESKFMKMVDQFPIFLISFLQVGCIIALIWLWSYLSYVENKAERLHCVLSPDRVCQYTVESLFVES